MVEERRLGSIEISPAAIASIASQAVLESYGVVGMAPRTVRDGLADMLHPADTPRKGVDVDLVDDKITIDLYVIMEYGVRVSEVAQNIMQSVKFNVEKALGVPVAEVNVHVQGLRISDLS
ncbi:MAG: Asp23/Gls24 family envelope stress response protein [Anaerolineae bacterium]|nr:Asp23/Gls24 family envelope stress response protein [Anaerolineae bacterium]NIN94069.1 Asp23/Gls24 family envelope stress response protein [Anaerolineae bacterium]NIQ77110.1 Asp23/Gls24 family envelope stress response protein [Anaerolineae bacterium]